MTLIEVGVLNRLAAVVPFSSLPANYVSEVGDDDIVAA